MFCYDESRNYNFYIEEVSVKYVYGWTEEERRRRFKGAKFIWGGCCDGVSYHDTLKSDNIENAKREFEAWYKQYLLCCVERLEDALAAAKEEYENFLQYQKEVK